MKSHIKEMLLAGIGGLLVFGGGMWWWRSREPVEVEIISQASGEERESGVWVDVGGQVVNPGVYKLETDARLKDAIMAAGGLGVGADRNWVARYVNMAQKVVDGAKIYIPAEGGEVAGSSETLIDGKTRNAMIDINSASGGELEKLPGIGGVRAQAITDGRPYGDIKELVERKILPASVFEKIKEQISVF